MCNLYSKVAVVTSASTTLGVEVCNRLAEEGYLVFAFAEENTQRDFNFRYLVSLPNVEVVAGQFQDEGAWYRLEAYIEEKCSQLKIPSKIDLLVNIPIVEVKEFDGESIEDQLDSLVSRVVKGSIISMKVMEQLLSKGRKSNIINIYPSAVRNPTSNFVEGAVSAILDTLTNNAAKQLRGQKTYVDSVCPDGFADLSYYHTDNSQLADDPTTLSILDMLHYLVEGECGESVGQKFSVSNNGTVNEVYKELVLR